MGEHKPADHPDYGVVVLGRQLHGISQAPMNTSVPDLVYGRALLALAPMLLTDDAEDDFGEPTNTAFLPAETRVAKAAASPPASCEDADGPQTPEEWAAHHGIEVKPGANISELTDQMVEAFDDIARAWKTHAPTITPVVTSGSDGQHGTGSLHYTGNAVDLRTRNLTSAQVQAITTSLRNSLGGDYDVIVESDHLHVEYDP